MILWLISMIAQYGHLLFLQFNSYRLQSLSSIPQPHSMTISSKYCCGPYRLILFIHSSYRHDFRTSFPLLGGTILWTMYDYGNYHLINTWKPFPSSCHNSLGTPWSVPTTVTIVIWDQFCTKSCTSLPKTYLTYKHSKIRHIHVKIPLYLQKFIVLSVTSFVISRHIKNYIKFNKN